MHVLIELLSLSLSGPFVQMRRQQRVGPAALGQQEKPRTFVHLATQIRPPERNEMKWARARRAWPFVCELYLDLAMKGNRTRTLIVRNPNQPTDRPNCSNG